MSQPNGAEDTGRRRLRLVLADDHAAVRAEIREFLDSEFEVVSTVGEGVALLRAAEEWKPDVVVSDIRMPLMDGLEAGGHLLRRGLCDAVVMLSLYSDAELVKTALDSGIRAYVLKMDASEELIPAVYAAMRGERYLSRGVRTKFRA